MRRVTRKSVRLLTARIVGLSVSFSFGIIVTLSLIVVHPLIALADWDCRSK